ncbi:MAG: thiamine diphosphokinase [Actinomycetes bacterium]
MSELHTNRIDAEPSFSLAESVVVFTGGDLMVGYDILLPVPRFVIAADSGLLQAVAFGCNVDLVVGDMDSVPPESLEDAKRSGAIVDRHPAAKDSTDFELALDAAIDRKPKRIVIVGGNGGRIDHFFAGVLALTRDELRGIEVTAHVGKARLHVVRDSIVVEGQPGTLVTLLAIRGEVGGIRTTGLLYPLRDESLFPGSTRGVSNEMIGASATISVDHGTLLVLVPGEIGSHVLELFETETEN